LRFDLFGKAFALILMPAFHALAIRDWPRIAARFTRAGVLEKPCKEFVVHYGRSRRYARRRIVWVYVLLRIPWLARRRKSGLSVRRLISSAVAVESIFDWPGVGSYAVNAI